MTEELWISTKDQTLSGQKVTKGQVIQRIGGVHAHLVFADNSRWAMRLPVGLTPILCDSDGCQAQFDCHANLFRHREIVHKPERDEQEQARLADLAEARKAEAAGETIGGREIVKVKRGPGGEVPYISPTG